MGLVLLEPSVKIEVVELLGPEHACQRLPMDAPLIFAERGRRDPVIKLVRIGNALAKNLVKVRQQIACAMGRETQPHGLAFSGRNTETIDCGSLRTPVFGVDRFGFSSNEV